MRTRKRSPDPRCHVRLHTPADFRKSSILYVPAWKPLTHFQGHYAQLGSFQRLHEFGFPEWSLFSTEEGISLAHDTPCRTHSIPWGIKQQRLLPSLPLHALPWWPGYSPIQVPEEVTRAATLLLREGQLPIPLTQHPPQLSLFPAPPNTLP